MVVARILTEERAQPDEEASKAARANWARLIRKVFEADPLVCLKCGSAMRVIAVIDREGPIRRILSHLGLLTGGSSGRSPPEEPPAAAREMQTELFPEDDSSFKRA